MPSFNSLAKEYATLYDSMEVKRRSVAEAQVDRILMYKGAYEEVEARTGVPWYIVGILDIRESGGRARRHLHNGDSLQRRTVRVPAGRPKTGSGPFTFVESAADALQIKRLHKIQAWTLERIAYEFERYNGWGYRRWRKIRSPYLWGGTTHQQRGKYVADGKFDRSVWDKQIGNMALLKCLCEKEQIELPSEFEATADDNPTPASNSSANDEIEKKIAVGVGTTATVGGAGVAISQTKEAVEVAKDIKSIAPTPPPMSSPMWPLLAIALLIAGIVVVARLRK